MKSFRILTAVLLASVFAFLTACQPDEISTGIDGKKPGVTNLGMTVAGHGSTALTVTWSAESAIKAGAASFSVQLCEAPDTTGGRLVAADMYNATISKTVMVEDGVTDYTVTISGQTLGDKLYLRVRANYKLSKYSDWTWLEDANGNKLIYKVGRGVITEGLEPPYLYKVTGTSTGIIVKWDAIDGATGYVVQYKRTGESDWTAVTLTAAQAGSRPMHKIDGLPSETSYTVRAKTVTAEGDSDYTDEVIVSTRIPGSFPKVMSTATQLIDWLESGVVEVNPGEEYSIDADIDLAGQSFTAMDESLLGIFNGNNHTVSGVSSTLFYSNEGTIKNLKVEGAIESSDPEVAALVLTNRGIITDVNVNIPVTYTVESDAEMRVAGIAISNEDGATIVNTTNEGAIKVSAKGNLKVPVLAAGIAAYSKGTVDNCINNGDVSFDSGNKIRGLAVAGIVAYLEGKVKASVNNGSVGISALHPDGYCDIVNTTGTSANTSGNSGTPAVGGIVAYGNGAGFEIDGCNNKGAVSYTLTSIDSYSSAAYQRTQVGGIVANPYGTVKNCVNDGPVSVSVMSSSGDVYTTKGHIICAGGIGGGDWFAGSAQDKTSYTDCTNNGNLSIYIASNASNSAVGGICGWPGAEASRTNKTTGCTNNGKITLTGPGKVRCGGIHGGSGAISNSVNNGEIVVNAGTNCAVGGISGFTSNGLKITGVKNYGNITAVPDGTYVGGLAGNLGNSAGAGGYTGKSVVRCTIRVGESSNAYTGMVIGYYNGTSAAVPAGSEGDPITVSGKYIYGSNTVALTSANYKTYLCGSTNYSVDSHPVYTAFDSTPYTDDDSGEEPESPALEAPANVTTTVMYNYLDVSWDAVSGAEWYVVEYKKEGDAAWTASPKILETTYRIEGLDHDASYLVRVKAYASTSSGYSSEEAIVTLEQVDLAAPVVTLTSKATSLTASWAAVSKATGYVVEYKKSADAEWTVASDNVAELSYDIKKLTPETSYDVRVRTLGEGGNMSADYSAVQTIATIALAYTYPLVISTTEDFLEWLSGAAQVCTSTDEVSLGADINLAGETLAPAESFAGIFDGAGHSIKNLNGSTPLFLVNTGTIKNLIIDASSSFSFAADDNKIFGTIAAQSSGTVKDCVNNAPVTVTSTADKAANCYLVAGVVGQTSGVVSGCKNYGAVKLTGKALSGTMVAGVVGYAAANVENCENHGNVSLEFTYTWQKAASSYIPLDYEKLVPGVSGIVGISQQNAKVTGCDNYGVVTYKETSANSLTANMNRHGIAGIVAAGGGFIENCKNEGALNVTSITANRAALTAYENILGVGGIAGHGYNAGSSQNAMSIKNCTNSGAITVDFDIQKSNTTIGGIVGWLGVESAALTMTVEGCSNTGNITVSGTGKGRFGGISGGLAIMKNCTNNATVTVNTADKASVAGLGMGFHTQGREVYGNTIEGTLAVNCQIDGAGGLYGGQGNAAEDGSKTYDNNVNATINADALTTNVGLVVGKFSTGTAVVALGSNEHPIKVKGSVNGIAITGENYSSYLYNGGNAVDNKSVNAVFWE